jgi:hypothetical protein
LNCRAGWLHKEWRNVVRQGDGVPMHGFTWYSLIDQTDWDTALRELNYRNNPCGLFNKERQTHPVGRAYTDLIKQWKPHLSCVEGRQQLAHALASSCRDPALATGNLPCRYYIHYLSTG